MSHYPGPARSDRDRFLDGVPAHLGLIQEAKVELERDPVEAAAALRRFASFVAEEAAHVGLEDVAAAALELSSAATFDLETRISVLEAALGSHLRQEEARVEILIVEDEPTSALLARSVLEASGRSIHVVRTAEKARRELQDRHVDLLILDLILPDADGRHLLMELSRELDARRTPVIVLTAKGSATTRAECFAYGARAFLEKPFKGEDLARIVTDVLKQGNTAADPIAELPDRIQIRDTFLRMQADRVVNGGLVLAIVETDPRSRGWDDEGRVPREIRNLHARVAAAVQDGLSLGDVVGQWGVNELIVLFSGREAEACVRVLEHAQGRIEPGGRSFAAGVTDVGEDALFEDAVSWASRLVNEARLSADVGILHTTLAKTRPPFVLVVEDDPVTASLLHHRFERSGFEVEVQEDGLRGLEAVRRALPDLLILDIRLPGMDGFEILSRMNDEGMTENVRTIVLTGLGRESDVSRAFSLGADDYLVKPFSPVELLARALRLIRR
jgi:DNA-binding response OmpR family regulator